MANQSIAGRSLKRGETTLEELRELTDEFVEAEMLLDDEVVGDIEGSDVDLLVVDGDLTIEGNFIPYEARLCFLVVKGNLTVRGCYRDYDDPATGIYVFGDLHAHDVVTRASLGVTGSLTATQALVGDYNDYGAEIRGAVRAKVFFPEEHMFELPGELALEHIIGYDTRYYIDGKPKNMTPLDDASLRRLIVPELIDADGLPNHEAFIERLLQGQPVLL